MSIISFIPKTTVAAPKTAAEGSTTVDGITETVVEEAQGSSDFIEQFNAMLNGESTTETSDEPQSALDMIKSMVNGSDSSTPSSTDFANMTIPTIQELAARFPGNIVEIKQQLLLIRDKMIEAISTAKSDLKSKSMSTYETHALSLHISDLEKNLQQVESNLSAIPGLLKSQRALFDAEQLKLREYLKAKWEFDNGLSDTCPDPSIGDLDSNQRIGDSNIVMGVLKDEDGNVVREAWINEDNMTEVLGTKTGMPIGSADSFVGIPKTLCQNNLDWLPPTDDADINTVISKDISLNPSDALANLSLKVGEYVYAQYDEKLDEFVVDEKDFGLKIAPTKGTVNGEIVMEAPDPDAYVAENIKYRAIRITELRVDTVKPKGWDEPEPNAVPWDKNVHGGDIQITAKDKDGRKIFNMRINGRSAGDINDPAAKQLYVGAYKKDASGKYQKETTDGDGNTTNAAIDGYPGFSDEANKPTKYPVEVNGSNYVCASSFSLAIVDSFENTPNPEELDDRETPMILNATGYVSTATSRMTRDGLIQQLRDFGNYTEAEAEELIDDPIAGYTLRRFLADPGEDDLADDNQDNPIGNVTAENMGTKHKDAGAPAGTEHYDHQYAGSMNTVGIIAKGQYSLKGSAFNDLVLSTEPSHNLYEKDNEGLVNPLANRYADMGNGFNAYIAAGGNNYVRGATFARIWKGKNPDPEGGQIAEVSTVAQMKLFNYYQEVDATGKIRFAKEKIVTNPRCHIDVDLPDGMVNIGNPYQSLKEDGKQPDNDGDPKTPINGQLTVEQCSDYPKNDTYKINAMDLALSYFEDGNLDGQPATQWGSSEVQKSGLEEKKDLEKAIREPDKLQVELIGGQGWVESPFIQQMRSEMDSIFSGWVNDLGYESAGLEGIDIETGEGVPATDEDYNSDK